jgi:hypothetical protein
VNLNHRCISAVARDGGWPVQAVFSARLSTMRTTSDMMRFNSKSFGV